MVAATRGCQSLIIIVGIMVPGQQGQPDYQSLIKMVGMMVTSKPALTFRIPNKYRQKGSRCPTLANSGSRVLLSAQLRAWSCDHGPDVVKLLYCSSVQCSNQQYNNVKFSSEQCKTVQYCNKPAVLCSAVQCSAVICRYMELRAKGRKWRYCTETGIGFATITLCCWKLSHYLLHFTEAACSAPMSGSRGYSARKPANPLQVVCQ